MSHQLTIIAGGTGYVNPNDTINYSEFSLDVMIDGINQNQEIPVRVLIQPRPPHIIAEGAARATFECVPVPDDDKYDYDGVNGHAVYTYVQDVSVVESGYFEGVTFIAIDMKGSIVKRSNSDRWDVGILACISSPNEAIPSSPQNLRVQK